MGGQAFSTSPPPYNYTPRMPPDIYTHMRDHLLAILRAHFARAECPIEAPGKQDYGDIDFLVMPDGREEEVKEEGEVGLERGEQLVEQQQRKFDANKVAGLIGAVTWKGGTPTRHFAVPWPPHQGSGGGGGGGGGGKEVEDSVPTPTAKAEEEAEAQQPLRISESPSSPSPSSSFISTVDPEGHDITPVENLSTTSKPPTEKFIQVDIHLCTTPSSFAWTRFYNSHGDLWSMLGIVLRPLGLTISLFGLYLRIPELEARDKKAARVLLTINPEETLRFLGLKDNEEKEGRREGEGEGEGDGIVGYWSPFSSVEALFRYVATCRFFDPGRWREREERRGKGQEGEEEQSLAGVPAKEEKEEEKKKRAQLTPVTSGDRARRKKRPIFRQWLEEYLPSHAEDVPVDPVAAKMSRDEVAEEAKRWFGVGKEYERRRRKGLRLIGQKELWNSIRTEIPSLEGERVGVVVRGLKREVSVKDQGGAELTAVQKAYAEADFASVLQWVRDEWRGLEERQRVFEKEKSTKHLLAKLERLRKEKKEEEEEKGKEGAD